MKGFVDSGDIVYHISYDEENLKERLTPRVYSVQFNKMQGFFLKKEKSKFELPELFGSEIQRKSKKVITKFKSKSTATGILLSGLKGGGKTLLSSLISNEMIELGYPVILVNEPFTGQGFMEFMNTLGTCVVFFDEFAKVYVDRENNNKSIQNQLLTLIDGTMKSKKLFIFTENKSNTIDEFLIGRPGRIHYHFKFDRLTKEIQGEYIRQYIKDPKKVEEIEDALDSVKDLTFDILSAVVDEVLLFEDQSVFELISEMNISIKDQAKLTARMFFGDTEIFNFQPNLSNKNSYIYVDVDKDGTPIEITGEKTSEDSACVDVYDNHFVKMLPGKSKLYECEAWGKQYTVIITEETPLFNDMGRANEVYEKLMASGILTV